jgi:hypothetical protein
MKSNLPHLPESGGDLLFDGVATTNAKALHDGLLLVLSHTNDERNAKLTTTSNIPKVIR